MKFVIDLAPKPQSRPRFTKYGRPYELKDMKEYKLAVERSVKEQMNGNKLVDVPISVSMTFYIEPPQYISKVKRNASALNDERLNVMRKPDIDNYVKAILDSMNDIVFKDDGQISELYAKKVYSLRPRTEVTVKVLEELR